ncbi:hypothetical protein [Paenibacillus sp. J2TS4]|uniref:hypothetical protein n=1 Tax=Paenibacillus sp. J2TS4 TaxID=2807194 RepID=UPI001B015F17|nr:hypothetical protein [Paenibacillus sp. J2TS4]GIP32604.1 hypothetical protein J2TS4_18140 [Paenibacillus sp. J2TS4]
MSTITDKLKLIKPALSDEIQQTIIDLGKNFQILDDASDLYLEAPPATGTWKRDAKIYKKNATAEGYIGWINLREGSAAPQWNPLKSYTVGDKVVTASNNGHVYECTQSGRSGVTEPRFPVSAGSTIKDIDRATTWQPSKKYELYHVVLPSLENNRFYVCTVAGISGVSEPTWSTLDGGTVDDGMVVWTGYRIATWKEAGPAASFRPFGKID